MLVTKGRVGLGVRLREAVYLRCCRCVMDTCLSNSVFVALLLLHIIQLGTFMSINFELILMNLNFIPKNDPNGNLLIHRKLNLIFDLI